VYLRFRDRAVAAGITVPIVPGLMPVINFVRTSVDRGQMLVRRFHSGFTTGFAGLEDDEGTRKLVGATVIASQVEALKKEGVTAFPFLHHEQRRLT